MLGVSVSFLRFASVAAVLLGACADETGVLIKVTTADGFDVSADRLRVYVGVDKIQTALDANSTVKVLNHYVDEKSPEDVSLTNRDLAKTPYSLLVHPGDDLESTLAIGAVLYDGESVVGFARVAKATKFISGSVLEYRLELGPVDPAEFRPRELECVGWHFEGEANWTYVGRVADEDCDGYISKFHEGDDCEPRDPNIHPGKTEDCTNGFDDNCNKQVDAQEDNNFDGDNFSICQGDCDDNNAAVYPGADEDCDGVDNDCNDLCDEGSDADGDSWTVCGSVIGDGGQCIAKPDDTKNDGLTDDDATIYPGAPELCDGKDNDLDGSCDNGDSDYEDPNYGKMDPDGDGFTWCFSRVDHCGTIPFADCAPEDPEIHPGAAELCDGVDNNCDGVYAESSPCFVDDGSGVCELGRILCAETEGVPGIAANCDDPALSAQVSGLRKDLTCEDYTTCNESDPWKCVLDGYDVSGATTCFVVSDAAGNQCEGDTVVIPGMGPGEADGCQSTLLGASTQQGFIATLNDGLIWAGCSAELRVVPSGSSGKAVIGVEVRNGVNAQTEIIELKDVQVEECEGRQGLECEGWTTL